jgi:hypothetical protein
LASAGEIFVTLDIEDALASLAALLDLLTHCDEDTKIETVQTTALLGWILLKNIEQRYNEIQ